MDAARAYRAIAALLGDRNQALVFLRQRVGAVVSPGKEITHLIEALGDEDFHARATATQAIEAMGEAAGPALRQALGKQLTLEARRRVEHLLAGVDADAMRAGRVVEVLELLDSSEVRPLLESLSKGMPEARLTVEARAALERLRKRR
jgi:hypothetical protein